MANSKKNVNSKNWSSGAISLTENYLIKINRSLILNQLDFFNLVKNKKSKILDIGCGFGYFLKFLFKKNYKNLIGIDPDKNLLKTVPKKIKTYSYYGNKTKFKNNSFDVIFIYMVLHHLHNDKEYYETVNEIHRILKPNGLVFITEPGRYNFFRFIEYVFYLLSFISKFAKTFSDMMKEEEKEQHYFLLNHHKVKNYLKRKKFKILKSKYFLYSWLYVGLKK
jgi:2-polyprenyl-3-methyl-5-hydroxy-6-metoxy-1,4-benzoquinol methylase